MAETGLVAIEGKTVVDWAVIKTSADQSRKATKDIIERVWEIKKRFVDFQDRHGGFVAIEAQVPGSMGRSSHAVTAKLYGAYCAQLALAETKPLWILPPNIKKRLTGRKGASKDEVRRICQEIVSFEAREIEYKYQRQAVWDAVAVIMALQPEISRLRESIPK